MCMNLERYFRELVSLPSPSRDEGKVSKYMKDKLSGFGYKFFEDSVGNLLFYKDIEGEKIMLSGHMDTVPPAVNAILVEDDEKFFTDGTTALGADDKCALAAILSVAEEYDGDNLLILLCVAEEIGLWGSAKLTRDFFSPFDIKHTYILDAQKNVGTVITKAVGKTRITLKFHGLKSHAGFKPEAGINAIVMAADFASSIKTGRLGENATSNIGSFISEGTTNVVPDYAEIVMEVRSGESISRQEIVEHYQDAATSIAKKHNGSVDIILEDLYTEYSIDKESEIVKRAIRAIESVGIEANTSSTTGGSDANNLNKIGIESVVLTSGYFNGHATSEYIEKKELRNLYKVAKALLI